MGWWDGVAELGSGLVASAGGAIVAGILSLAMLGGVLDGGPNLAGQPREGGSLRPGSVPAA